MAADVIEASKETVQSKEGTTNTAVPKFAYPKSIESNSAHTSYLIFSIVKPEGYNSLNDQSLRGQQKSYLKNPASMKRLGMIRLYMPAIAESLNHEYAKSDTSLLSDIAKIYLEAEGDGAGEKLANSAGPAMNRAADVLQQMVLNNPTSVQATGQIHGQRQTLLYGGTSMRTQTFTFQLRPRNMAELKEIGEIVHMFRKYSSGSHGSSVIADAANVDSIGTIDVPPVWFIEERLKSQLKPRYTDMFFMGPCAVTSVRVNKTPDQVQQTLANTAGDPVAIELEITVQEMVPVYSDFWDDSRARRSGVGIL